jgi:MFS transporter, DHA1 family, multidrug resistance protein
MNERKSSTALIIFILGALDTIAPLTIDMYLPAFSQMASDFETSTARVSLSLTSYFVGLGLGQIFYGPFLDRFGRHRPLYAGMALYVLSCIACAWSSSVQMLIFFRFTQAVGGAASAVAVRAMVRDYFSIEAAPRIFSMLMLILSVSPLFAPSLGGIITIKLTWEWIFFILAGLAFLICLIMFLFLPETYKPDHSVSMRIKPMMLTFVSIMKNPQFSTYTLATSFSFGGLFIYLAGSTVILQDRFNVSPQFYAILFALQSIGLIVGNQLNIFLLKNYPAKQIFRLALTVQMTSASIYLAGTIFDWYGIYSTISFFFILLACLGMTFPNGSATALEPFRKDIGSASSLMGFLQICLGGLISASVGLFNAKDSLAIAIMLFVTGVLAWAVLMTGAVISSRTLPMEKLKLEN